MKGFIEITTVHGFVFAIGIKYIEEFKPNSVLPEKLGLCEIYHSGEWVSVKETYEQVKAMIIKAQS